MAKQNTSVVRQAVVKQPEILVLGPLRNPRRMSSLRGLCVWCVHFTGWQHGTLLTTHMKSIITLMDAYMES